MDEELDEMYFEAASWLRLALTYDPSIPDANYLLGLFYEQGLSVDLNHEHACKHYESAASNGHAKSMTKLGHLAYSGVRKAEFLQDLHSEAASVSPVSGQSNDFMYAMLPDKMRAAKFYYSAAHSGQDTEALNCLGLLYEQGLGLNLSKANSTNPLNVSQKAGQLNLGQRH